MNKLFIRIGEQTFAVNHITHVCRYGAIVTVRVVSCPEPIQLKDQEAEAFWEWHTSALYTTTLYVPRKNQESEPVAVS